MTRREHELCEACPKLCSFACPVSEATSREALTPWGKMSLAALAPEDPSAAFALAGCTGCLRCQQHCAHGNDVPSALYAARASSVRAGVAPSVWTELAARFAASGHGEAVELSAVRRSLDAGRAPAAGPILFAGCDALAAGGASVRAALFVARALGAPLSLAPEGALCCGLKLVEAGWPDAFAAHARSTLHLVRGNTAAPLHVVFLQPGCARAVLERYPALPAGSRVEHVTTYLSRALARMPGHMRPPPLPGAVAYHDPCELSRGLSEVTAPRALLSAAFEGGVLEPVRCGVQTSCCGAGGLLPRTLPEVAAKMAALRAGELAACGAPAVTASPGCAAALDAGEVVSVLARWLGASRASGSGPAMRTRQGGSSE